MSIPTKLDARLHAIPPESYSRILSTVARIDELKGQWTTGARLHPQILGSLKQSILITSTGASTRIEGSRMSDEDIRKMLRGISIQTFRNRDIQEVKGYYELLRQVFDSWVTLHMSEGLVKSFHKELLRYVEKDELHRGDYKRKENKVIMIDGAGNELGILFDTTPAYLTPFAMQELVEWTLDVQVKRTHHPLLIIGSFLVEFLKIHPFEDGNGRMSRILTNLLLLQAGYTYMPYVSHEKIIEDNKPEYYIALRTSQNTFGTGNENIDPWLMFFLEVILKQTQLAVGLITEERFEMTLSKIQMDIWQYIQKKKEVTAGSVMKDVGVMRSTVKQVFSKFLRSGKIEMLGAGRGTRYRMVE